MLLLLFALNGCDPSPGLSPQSKPISRSEGGGGRVDLNVGADGPKPIAVAELLKRYPKLKVETVEVHQSVAAAANVVPGPCEACDGLPLAHCVTQESVECPVGDGLIERATRLARSGMDSERLKVAINYPDFWFPDLGEGTPVTVHLWTDGAGLFKAETDAAKRDLEERFGEKVKWVVHAADESAPPHLGVRSRPTWFINGHRLRGAQSARTIGRLIQFELVPTDL